ncbi:hypothetical protein FRC02_004261 [Tulasnella sp. 418]|nr:hypothetical protein FRC02_004261 [Tulasnella sp. 418]
MPAGAALAFAAAVECVAKHKAGQKHSTILGENEVQPITETEQKKSPLKKLKAFAARKIGGCRRPTKSKAKSPNRLQNPAQTSLEPTSDAPRGTLSANASIKPATSLQARAEDGERSVDRDLPFASPQPVEAIPDITCDVGVTSVLPRIDSESPGRAGEDLPAGEQVEVASDCIAIPLPLEKQVEFIGKRYPFKENVSNLIL